MEKYTEQEKILIFTLGASIDPVKESINVVKPDYIVCLASNDTLLKAQEIYEAFPQYTSDKRKQFVIENPGKIADCYQKSKDALFHALKRTIEDSIFINYTGGTKAMSVGIVLAARGLNVKFLYISGDRDKKGIGNVISGTEVLSEEYNPWIRMALTEINLLKKFSKNFSFSSAASLCETIYNRDNIDKSLKQVADILRVCFEGLAKWDRFEYYDAHIFLRKSQERFEDLACLAEAIQLPEVALFIRELFSKHIQRLSLIQEEARTHRTKEEKIPLMVLDIMANAERCAKTGQFPNAVVRIYTAFEVFAKLHLMSNDREPVDNARVSPDIIRKYIPEDERRFWRSKTDKNGVEYYDMGLFQSFTLLKYLNHPAWKIYENNKNELTSIMDARNSFIHNLRPVDKKTFEILFKNALEILRMESLEQMPVLG